MQGAVGVVFQVVERSALSRFLDSTGIDSFPDRSGARPQTCWASGGLSSSEHPAALEALGAAGG